MTNRLLVTIHSTYVEADKTLTRFETLVKPYELIICCSILLWGVLTHTSLLIIHTVMAHNTGPRSCSLMGNYGFPTQLRGPAGPPKTVPPTLTNLPITWTTSSHCWRVWSRRMERLAQAVRFIRVIRP